MWRAVGIATLVSALAAGCGDEAAPRRSTTAPARRSGPLPTQPATTRPGEPLTEELLRSLPDERLERAVVDSIIARIGADYDREAEIVRGLGRGMRMAYTTWLVEAEVADGGFNQYFWNTSGRLAAEALEGYKLIGAKEHAAVLEKAIATYRREEPKLRKFRIEGTPEALRESYEHTELNGFDDEFLGLAEDAGRLRARYIREHPDEFVGR